MCIRIMWADTQHRHAHAMSCVLVVDDRVENLELAAYLLRSAGHTALATSNPSEAFQLTLEHQPEIVLLDLNLGSESGHVLLEALRADERTHDVKVALFTATATPSEVRLAIDAGFVRGITKPYDPRLFVDQIEQLIHAL